MRHQYEQRKARWVRVAERPCGVGQLAAVDQRDSRRHREKVDGQRDDEDDQSTGGATIHHR